MFVTKPLEVPGKAAPLHVPQQGPCGKRSTVSTSIGLFLRLYEYLSESSSQGTLPWKMGKHTVTVHGAPRGRKAYIQWGATSFLKGIVYDAAISILRCGHGCMFLECIQL